MARNTKRKRFAHGEGRLVARDHGEPVFFTYVILKESKVGEMGDFLTAKLLYI